MALLLLCSRRALAYLALTLTIIGHCFLAALVSLFLVANPGELFIGISLAEYIVIFRVGHVLCFLGVGLRSRAAVAD